MCILIFKPKGIEIPDNKILENCFDSNPDGGGIAYRLPNGMIQILKGFMTFDDFKNNIDPLRDTLKGTDVILHMRIGTKGSKIPANTHPFPVTTNIDELKSTSIVVNGPVIGHNGIIMAYSSGVSKNDLSDTMILSKKLYTFGEDDPEIVKILNFGKFVIMDSDSVRKYGSFIEDKGIFYSNSTYKGVIIYRNYKKYDNFYNYGLYDDDYDIVCPPILDIISEDDDFCKHELICSKTGNCIYSGLKLEEELSLGLNPFCPISFEYNKSDETIEIIDLTKVNNDKIDDEVIDNEVNNTINDLNNTITSLVKLDDIKDITITIDDGDSDEN